MQVYSFGATFWINGMLPGLAGNNLDPIRVHNCLTNDNSYENPFGSLSLRVHPRLQLSMYFQKHLL
nr:MULTISPECIES: hypothetical protein [Paenibacillus]